PCPEACRWPSAGRPGSAAEALAIRPRGHSQRSDEAAPQALRSPESAAPGDVLQREIRLLDLLSCGSEADLPDVVAGCEADPVGEVAGEAALAHGDPLGPARHGEVLVEALA